MTTRTRATAATALGAIAIALAALCASSPAVADVAPLPASDYSVRQVCPTPSSQRASCLALSLVPRTAQARAYTHPLGVARTSAGRAESAAAGDYGLTPSELHTAYQLPTQATSTQTIALVDAYNDLGAEADLKAYDHEFGLPECTAADGCFAKVNQHGETGNLPFPRTQGELETARVGSQAAREAAEEAEGWAVEISLDIETAHAICQNCKIALVEANSPSYSDLDTAEDAAVALGADEISNSWAGPECFEGSCISDNAAFNHPGVVIAAAAGDDGYRNWLGEPPIASANFPASSPHVVAVGGTRLQLGAGGEWQDETVWNDGGLEGGFPDGHGAGGGSCSAHLPAPSWQLSLANWAQVGCPEQLRAVSDVAADADPYTGVAVYDSQSGEEWEPIGGTSLASPLIAAVYALAGGAQGVNYPARTLYENALTEPESLHDVSEGSNGECAEPFDEETGATGCSIAEEAQACAGAAICDAGSGYDGPTGVGTPDGIAAFQSSSAGSSTEPGGSKEEPAVTHTSASTEATASGAGGSTTAAGPGTPVPTAPPLTSFGPTPDISHLALTTNGLIALNRSHPRVSALSFTFLASVAMRVRVTLSRAVRAHGRTRWQTVGASTSIAAARGQNSHRLGGRTQLGPGSYRLMLTPARGAARSLAFAIG